MQDRNSNQDFNFGLSIEADSGQDQNQRQKLRLGSHFIIHDYISAYSGNPAFENVSRSGDHKLIKLKIDCIRGENFNFKITLRCGIEALLRACHSRWDLAAEIIT